MCGILFLYHQDLPQQRLQQRMHRAMALLAHRGPDGAGLWCDPPATLGHRRLAIVDLAASLQPMTDAENRYVLTYNGEIYNYEELRRSLSRNWSFRTQGDTEVVLAGLVLYGESFLARMEGMWAFALWDNKQQTLLLSRDRFGKKPLFYRQSPQQFACASELSAVAMLTEQPWEEDLHSTADYFRYGYYLPGTTAYQGVYEVLPGHVALWSPGQPVQQHPYWQLPLERFPGSYAQACAMLHEKLSLAVQRRLVADVEVGAFLSGGIDSSLIVGLLTQSCGVTPQTFTIGFADKTFDESAVAAQTAQHWHTRHHEHCLSTWDAQLLSHLTLQHIGQPFIDTSLLPTALVSQFAAQHVKVVLSGDGGDELFGGYQRYQAQTLLRWYHRLPRALRSGGESLIRALPEPMAHHSHSLLKKAHLFCDILDQHNDSLPYVAPRLYSHRVFTLLAPELLSYGHTPPRLPEETSVDHLKQMMATDALMYLPQDILAKVDRASMAHSLETRCPFLDSEVVKLAFSLPSSWHRRGFAGKRMLRSTFKTLLPATIWQRRKQGFALPVHQWFRESLGEQLGALLAATSSQVLSRMYVLTMLQEHRQGYRDHGHRLWGIYIYLRWQETLKSQKLAF